MEQKTLQRCPLVEQLYNPDEEDCLLRKGGIITTLIPKRNEAIQKVRVLHISKDDVELNVCLDTKEARDLFDRFEQLGIPTENDDILEAQIIVSKLFFLAKQEQLVQEHEAELKTIRQHFEKPQEDEPSSPPKKKQRVMPIFLNF